LRGAFASSQSAKAIATQRRPVRLASDCSETVAPCWFLQHLKNPGILIANCRTREERAMIPPTLLSSNDANTRRYRKLFVRRFGVFNVLR
jgi:hypothetical protein